MEESPDNTTTTTEEGYWWCYNCEKRVRVLSTTTTEEEEEEEDSSSTIIITCLDCSQGFVESIPHPSPTPPLSPPPPSSSHRDFNSHFLHVLRLLSNPDSSPPPPPPPPLHNPDRGDYLRVHLDPGDDDDDDVVDPDTDLDPSLNRDVLRLRLRDLAASRRNRILDWAEILMGLEDRSINLRLHEDAPDGFDLEDYLDAAGYEALLRDLAESDARRGAPPASQEAILALENLEIKSIEESVDCAVCKDGVGVGEMGKKMPCGHVYHKDCIVPWLGSRNSCPVCRYELETDDLEYERERSMRMKRDDGPSSSSSG